MTEPKYDLTSTLEWNPGTAVPVPFGEGNVVEGRGWELEDLKGTFEFTAEEESIGEMLFSLRKWPFVDATTDGTEIEVVITDFVVREVRPADGPADGTSAKRWICTPVDWTIK